MEIADTVYFLVIVVGGGGTVSIFSTNVICIAWLVSNHRILKCFIVSTSNYIEQNVIS